METNAKDQQNENVENQTPVDPGAEQSADHDHGEEKKKHHSSALAAARLAHSSVDHVKPTHSGLDL